MTSTKVNDSSRTSDSYVATNKGIVENWVKAYSKLPMNELELMAQGMSDLNHVMPHSELKITLAKAISRQGAVAIDAFIDVDECTAHMVSINAKGTPLFLSIKTLIELIKGHCEGKAQSYES